MDIQKEKQMQDKTQPGIHVPRDPIAMYSYAESQTHGLIIKKPRRYSLNMIKYKPYDPK